ncbi:MarR family transcriptional regulator [Halalkalibacter sp. APA_J-10(15)]|uniref:MarR family winged helix-turn-helix transcriptional regulator n=1 Tax=unclassified Halalkalibacter TaxID=2893063 RepID=UPI0027E558F2|nr:MarR family transcriptional regulator [Halalkalibacter sp. APA_J-10(15)]
MLSRASIWLSKHSDRQISKHGLTTTEFAVLELLYHKGTKPLQQIGEKILTSNANTTYVIDKLEKKQFLKRKRCSTDRRTIYAELTDAGRSFIEDIFPEHEQVIKDATAGLSEEEMLQAIELLKKIGLYAKEHY